MPAGLHLAIIPDGNGRWAAARGLPRAAGHGFGVEAVRRTLRAAPGLDIGTLTLFAFSSENWKRPAAEVAEILGLVEQFLLDEAPRLARRGVRVSVIGRRDRLPRSLRAAVESAEAATVAGRRMRFRLALDYSSRAAILRAACRLYTSLEVSEAALARCLAGAAGQSNGTGAVPDVDLLVRTGGEQRLSDFLLWECAWAELVFLPRMWPEFTAADLAAAVAEFHARQRRFGALVESAAS